MKAIHTPTQEEYNQVVQIMLDKGWRWVNGYDMINEWLWEVHIEETCVRYQDDFLYRNRDFYTSNGAKIISVADFLKLEGAKETKKPTGGEWTYERADGVPFTKDSIQEPGCDAMSLEAIEDKKIELREEAKKLQYLQASHKKLFNKK